MIDENDTSTADLFEAEFVFANWCEGLMDEDNSEQRPSNVGDTCQAEPVEPSRRMGGND